MCRKMRQGLVSLCEGDSIIEFSDHCLALQARHET